MIQGYVNSATEKGSRPYQEDRFVVIRHETHEEKGWLIAVMDGHGGSEVAEFCEKNLESKFKDLMSKSKNIVSIAAELVKRLTKETRHMTAGSTISLVYISETKSWAYVAVLGDSPVVIKSTAGLWISPEHNIRTNEKDKELVLKKGAIYCNGYMCGLNGNSALQLTRALGDFGLDRYLIRDPEIFSVELNKNSFVLVASDGLIDPGHNNKDISNLVRIIENDETAYDLVNDALRRRTGDNVTAVLWKPLKNS